MSLVTRRRPERPPAASASAPGLSRRRYEEAKKLRSPLVETGAHTCAGQQRGGRAPSLRARLARGWRVVEEKKAAGAAATALRL